jgi:hypothetical protein
MVSETEARKTERQVHRFAHAATTRYNSTSRLTHISSVIWRRRVLQSLLKAEARKIRCHRAHEVAHVDEGRRDLHFKGTTPNLFTDNAGYAVGGRERWSCSFVPPRD